MSYCRRRSCYALSPTLGTFDRVRSYLLPWQVSEARDERLDLFNWIDRGHYVHSFVYRTSLIP